MPGGLICSAHRTGGPYGEPERLIIRSGVLAGLDRVRQQGMMRAQSQLAA